MFEDTSDIAIAVQNPNHAERVIVDKVINSDRPESANRPNPQVLKLRVAYKVAWAKRGMLPERLNR